MMAEIRSERLLYYYFYYTPLSSISYLGALYLTWNHLFPNTPGGNIHNILNFQHNQPGRHLSTLSESFPVSPTEVGIIASKYERRGGTLAMLVQSPAPVPVSGQSEDKCVSVTISTLTLITICYSSPHHHKTSLSPGSITFCRQFPFLTETINFPRAYCELVSLTRY